jgi:hypothetical protein
LLAQCYYAQADWEGLAHHLNAFELFLRRKKDLPIRNKNSYLNFAKLLKYAAKVQEQTPYIKPEIRLNRVKRYQERVQRTEPLAYREWLESLLV